MTIDYGETDAQVIAFDQQYGIEFPSVSGTQGGGDAVFNTYGVQYVPTYIIIAPNHDIVNQGFIPSSTQSFINTLEAEGIEQANCSSITANFTSDVTDLCQEGTVNFMDMSSGGDITSWEWTFEGGDPATSTEQNPSVYYETLGNWDVTLVVNGDEGDEITIEDYIGVYELPEVSLDPFEITCIYWEPFALTGGQPDGGVYHGPGVNHNVFDPEAAGVGEHTITYTYTSEDGCANTAEETLIVDECTGINEPGIGQINIYPNPADNMVHVNSGSEITTLEVYSYTGQMMERIDVNHTGYLLNTSAYPAGVYSMTIRTIENKIIKKRLVVR